MRVLLLLLALASAQLPDERFNRLVFSEDPMAFEDDWDVVIEVDSMFDGTSPTFDFDFVDLDDDAVINATADGEHEMVQWSLSNIVEAGSGVDWDSAWLEYTDSLGHSFVSTASCNHVILEQATCVGFLEIPALVPSGTYEGKAWLSDMAGNTREVATPPVQLISPFGDSVAPTFIYHTGVDLIFVNQSSEYRFVDVYNGAGRLGVYVDVNATDFDLDYAVGAYAAQGYYGDDIFEFDMDCWHRNNTDMNVFRCLGYLQFGRDTRPNHFLVISVTVFDIIGNSETWDLSNYDVDFEVKNENYMTMRPPTCKRSEIDNNDADATEEDDMVQVRLYCDWYDGNSDRNFAQVVFESPEVMIDGVATRVTAQSNIYSFDNNNEWEHNVYFHQWVPNGEWTLKRVLLFTDSGDASEYTATAVVDMSSSGANDDGGDDDGNDGGDDAAGAGRPLSSSLVAIVPVAATVAAVVGGRLL